ncbi:hypothetical protein BGW36DRAFT_451568 [Talaromyces proteolyticus]|uniref:Carboxylesterase type B domain-containing protein n=1 Tax=Talaromyces proteolyticus TaxID=1131652 RepID=A0AAD4KTK4_9EURO|nr:uncharacterized protein BGW36DRAFT_451568 [Talaromyces proteolyticus]KAH8696281.1 hypothetical protein BGW36DRAFT_451568 [Talaromyces proteolyticus]
MPQSVISEFGVAHTVELPYLFGNLDFNFNSSCNATPAEYSLGEKMRGLWTAMAENADPSTESVHWPQFQITANGSSTPGLIIGNSTEPGLIDFSACKLWAQVNATILASNATATAAPTPSGSPTASSTRVPPTNGAVTILPSFVGWSVLMMAFAVFF